MTAHRLRLRAIERKAGQIDDARPPTSALEDLHAGSATRAGDAQVEQRACAKWIRNAAGERCNARLPAKQQHPASLILGRQLQAPQDDVIGCGDPGQHARARPRAHGLLDCPQPAFAARRGMNHQ